MSEMTWLHLLMEDSIGFNNKMDVKIKEFITLKFLCYIWKTMKRKKFLKK